MNTIQKEIIIVNDCSKDNTEEAIKAYQSANPTMAVTYYKHDINQGKGAAIRTGIQKATGDWVIIQDADLEYDPQDYHKLIPVIESGKEKVVYGSRFISNDSRRVIYFLNTIANKILTFFLNCVLNLNFTDVETGYKAFKTEFVKKINVNEKGFGFEIEITIKLAKIQAKFYEVGITYNGRTISEGKKIRMKHFFEAIYCIIKYKLF